MTQYPPDISQRNITMSTSPHTQSTASAAVANADSVIAAIIQAHPWLAPDKIARNTQKILLMNASTRSKKQVLIKLADQVNEAILPYAACNAGCSHCCSMPTLIYQYEAEQLAEVSGRPFKKLNPRSHTAVMARAVEFHGQVCPFLSQGRCSVYEVRPMICRLHHSLNATPENCICAESRIRKPVIQFDPDWVEVPYHRLARQTKPAEPWGVIQEFFPDM
jgi:Fe-S-cluster containining protein